MHPILFRIPLPSTPLKAWYALALVAAVALVYVVLGLRRNDRGAAVTSLLVAVGAGLVGFVLRDAKLETASLPIYSYGGMLTLSLVVGWFLTLGLAERDGLPRETMGNAYVVTAFAALAGSRLLYVATNADQFKKLADVFVLSKGGYVAYGGFLAGLVASWLFLRAKRISLLPWADVAAPSLAAGLFVTRIGCYLFGCDFGRRLSDGSPEWLKKAGTFQHWTSDIVTIAGEGPAAYEKHRKAFEGTSLGSDILRSGASLPVHPTQIYESLVGLLLLALLLWQRKRQRFRGQVFFLFAFAYGYLRFLLEILRDDSERGSVGPYVSEHVLVPVCLLLMGAAFAYGLALGVNDLRLRTVARGLAFVPPVVAFLAMRPASFAKSTLMQLSTSQLIGLVSALLVAWFYAEAWKEARKKPRAAMAPETLGPGALELAAEENAPGGATATATGRKKKVTAAGPVAAAAPSTKDAAADEGEREDDDEDEDAAGGGDEDDERDERADVAGDAARAPEEPAEGAVKGERGEAEPEKA